jgi:hypothetical protein
MDVGTPGLDGDVAEAWQRDLARHITRWDFRTMADRTRPHRSRKVGAASQLRGSPWTSLPPGHRLRVRMCRRCGHEEARLCGSPVVLRRVVWRGHARRVPWRQPTARTVDRHGGGCAVRRGPTAHDLAQSRSGSRDGALEKQRLTRPRGRSRNRGRREARSLSGAGPLAMRWLWRRPRQRPFALAAARARRGQHHGREADDA